MCLSQAIVCIPTKAQQPIEWGFQIQNLIKNIKRHPQSFKILGEVKCISLVGYPIPLIDWGSVFFKWESVNKARI
jgi:hypothetical protein